jgi:hypothetical protein
MALIRETKAFSHQTLDFVEIIVGGVKSVGDPAYVLIIFAGKDYFSLFGILVFLEHLIIETDGMAQHKLVDDIYVLIINLLFHACTNSVLPLFLYHGEAFNKEVSANCLNII